MNATKNKRTTRTQVITPNRFQHERGSDPCLACAWLSGYTAGRRDAEAEERSTWESMEIGQWLQKEELA